jgi:hypothetical protein
VRGGATRTAEGESANVLSVGRVYFNEDNGHDLLTQYGTAAFDDEHTKRGYLALAAAVRAADAPGFLSLAAQIALAPCCCGIEWDVCHASWRVGGGGAAEPPCRRASILNLLWDFTLIPQAALIKYIEYVQSVLIAPKSLNVCWRGMRRHGAHVMLLRLLVTHAAAARRRRHAR